MNLYLVRHGVAVPKDENPNQPLSERGNKDVARMASFLARAGVSVSRVIHSGKPRAAQTALLLADVLGPGRMVEEASRGLAPNDGPEILAAAVDGFEADVMLVGHLPLLGRLAALLTTGDETQSVVRFDPGAVCRLSRGANGDGWTIDWALQPRLLGA